MISRFFIDRPIFAGVISVLITFVGGIFVWTLPIAQYPEIAPPSVQVSCIYPGANSVVVAETVGATIEQQVTGVENMLYMSSQSTNDGAYNLTVTFELGTDLDMAQVLVQNRVNLALPALPSEVKQTGVTVKKRSPSILLAINLFSPQQSRDQLFLSNFATIRLKDELARLEGVGDISLLGQQDYSMRIWLNPERMAVLGLTATDILNALREQNVQVAAGSLGRPPIQSGEAFQYTLTTQGRLIEPEQFGEIILKRDTEGRVVTLADVVSDRRPQTNGKTFGGIELGAKNQDMSCALDGSPSVGIAIYQLPGANALNTAAIVQEKMKELRGIFPEDVDYKIVYDTTPFISESITEVFKALRDAIILVAIVVLVFLQSWRAAIIPLVAVPVAIIGTFAVMAGFGFSLNNLSLFGLVLAIGIVVDDAIVVVEAVEHKLEHGGSPVEATREAMDEVSSPIVAISIVLMCVFIPCLFISGITGQFFSQFAVTIAVSTFFSALNSLTLSPALAALLLRPKDQQTDFFSKLINGLLGWFFKLFNVAFEKASDGYAWIAGWLLRLSFIVLIVYGGLLWLTYFSMTTVPTGFIPSQDKGYLLLDIRLPDSASFERTSQVMSKLDQLILGERMSNLAADEHSSAGDHGSSDQHADKGGVPGVAHTMAITGQSVVQSAVGSNFGSVFVILDEFHHRESPQETAQAISQRIRKLCAEEIQDGVVSVFGPPPVDGLGSGGGFKIVVRDVGALGLPALQRAADELSQTGSASPEILGMVNSFRASTPQLYVDVDRVKCKALGVSLSEVFTTLQTLLGGAYANDFNQFGRTWQVNLQADPAFRVEPSQIGEFRVRSMNGDLIPLGTLVSVRDASGPAVVTRYNGVAAAAINGIPRPGVSSGQVVKTVDGLVAESLPFGVDAQWTELTLLQILAGNTAILVFGVAVFLVILILAAQYESVRLPFAVILVVPLCLLSSVAGIAMSHLDINIFVQIGFVVLIGLASKNAILIVEFAKEQQAAGMSRFDATIMACRLRLRPIMMTSFAFILGVVPLAMASGAGAEMRRPLGIAVFSGMLGVTFFGIFLTPVFYYLLANREQKESVSSLEAPEDPQPPSDEKDSASSDDESEL